MSHSPLGIPAASEWLSIWEKATIDYCVALLSPTGIVLTWNVGGEHIHRYRPDEIIGRHFSVFYTPDDRAAGVPQAVLVSALATGRHELEGWRLRKDGSSFWANVVLTRLDDRDGKTIGFAKVVRDVSDKRAAHEAVVESERRFRLLVQGVTDYAIFMLSPEGYITNWNPGARRIKGYTAEEIIGSHFSRFYTPEDRAAGVPQRGLATAAREGRFEAEGWRVRRDGSRFFAHVIIDAIRNEDGALLGFAKVTRDITERRKAAEQLEQTRAQLFQSQKMEAIGKLTGGVAHDFNNVLQVIRGNLELLRAEAARDVSAAQRVDNALEALERGAKLASQLLAFGRRQPLQPTVVNLSRVMAGMDDMLRHALGEPVKLETVVSGGLWNTFVDTHQLENVILNLVINARDAMPQGGHLTIELLNAVLDDRYVASTSDVPAGQYVMVAVTDTGTGMPADVAERAFDPFFTTKPEGSGSGLGLSMAYGFVKQSGGHIKIYSEVGHGTTVKLYLPRSTDAEEVTQRTSEMVPLMLGNETVLVVEDDDKVRATTIEMLAGLGYKVLQANSPEAALTIISSGVYVDLLFTDVVMPGPMTSMEMVRQAQLLRPTMKVLFTSGYTHNSVVHGGRLDRGVELLSKPYGREELSHKIRQVLGRRGTPDLAAAIEPIAAAAVSTSLSRPAADSLRVLVVDDEPGSLDAVAEILRLLGHDPHKAASAREALDAIATMHFDALLADIRLPDMSGIDLAKSAAKSANGMRIVFASGDPMSIDGASLPFEWRAIRKPFSVDDLKQALSA
ncbi:PAS domain S-box-containing protein [Trinickia symbiotica]|uniref:histidine kinase n=1 Tax=Trinickia symbiotica TaxID=863227 RepID=A0A2N7X2B3_9BURK|nr:PAS domain-containing sensor histidine kinase [Trinickia symbiotica]PMS35899.1 hybrid sensor histidine kinase/response regulator [Trinickia symbiotica]PPK44450.1 PAS domain S-box-containing protein [Trinickia symbiotica]